MSYYVSKTVVWHEKYAQNKICDLIVGTVTTGVLRVSFDVAQDNRLSIYDAQFKAWRKD
jgi:hypothetical protein